MFCLALEMKQIILLVLFGQIILEICAYEHKIAHRRCGENTFPDCYSYCNKGCKDNPVDCIHYCEKGCGCIEGSIVRNNGGCRRIKICDKEDDSLSIENNELAEKYVTAHWDDPANNNADENHPPTIDGLDENKSGEMKSVEQPNEVPPESPVEDADPKPAVDAI
ncbi:uncharacterized protein LOC6734806 [Drosophila simulans]|uniref:TIL domain-containing protein n=2 Tax=Drosophila simulans TaxID=7240 RepID=A0A0J9RFI0_DROSI|nr:uncharacterized protein LOC6734806 [Drosophila simulans]KMY94329.1 uncharacterized protein Dsimw501_GD25522 [Drosophila simulans]